MSTGPEEPSRGQEFPPLEDSVPPDPHAPVDYPTEFAQPGYPPPAYPPPAYPQSGYPPPGPPPPGYPPPYAGGYGYGGYDPYAQVRPSGTNGKAIGSLVTSLAGLFFCGVPSVVGLILGVIAMRETKQTGQEGYGMALAGVIVGALSVVGWLLYVVVIIFFFAVASTSPPIGY